MNNLDWFGSMGFLEFLREIGKYARVGTMMAKDSVKTRLTRAGMSFTEFSYQLLQGYDFATCTRNTTSAFRWAAATSGATSPRARISSDASWPATAPTGARSAPPQGGWGAIRQLGGWRRVALRRQALPVQALPIHAPVHRRRRDPFHAHADVHVHRRDRGLRARDGEEGTSPTPRRDDWRRR